MPLSDFQVVIGLEVHAQLLTKSKLFSSASMDFGAPANTQTTAVCLAMPGALPVPNAAVVELAMRAGAALGCTINPESEWSRKHYFYPDLPKGYQITQYERPICEWGAVAIGAGAAERPVRIRRIHIEEDAGKSVHDAADGLTLIDLNRAGTPLLEIVSEPDLRSADEAVEYLKALREVLVFIGVNDGNLEEGSFRCDANVSVMRREAQAFGTRCELKNLNSFRFIKQAIEYETRRQVELIEGGGQVEQESRLYDPDRGETRSMRSKEDAHDYRYFPEPDLPLLRIAQDDIDRVRAALPVLPRERRRRYVEALKLPEYDAGVLTADRALSDLFERCVAEGAEPKKVSNWFMGELARLLKASGRTAAEVKFTPAQLKALLAAVEAGTLSGSAAKDVFAEMFERGVDPQTVIEAKGLAQSVDAGALEAAVDAVLQANPKSVEGYRAGNAKLLGFLVGQVMKATQGKANPKRINELLVQRLGG